MADDHPSMAEVVRDHLEASKEIDRVATEGLAELQTLSNQLLWLTGTLGPGGMKDPNVIQAVMSGLALPTRLLREMTDAEDPTGDGPDTGDGGDG